MSDPLPAAAVMARSARALLASAGGASCCTRPGMLGTIGGWSTVARSLGRHLGSLARDIGCGGALVEVIGTVPGQDRTPGSIVVADGVRWRWVASRRARIAALAAAR